MTRASWGWQLDERRRRDARRRALRRMAIAWIGILAAGLVVFLAGLGFMVLFIVTFG